MYHTFQLLLAGSCSCDMLDVFFGAVFALISVAFKPDLMDARLHALYNGFY